MIADAAEKPSTWKPAMRNTRAKMITKYRTTET